MPLFFVAAIGLGGLALFAALSSRAPPPASSGAPPPSSTGGGAPPPNVSQQQDTGGALGELDGKSILDIAGAAGGLLARESAFTNTAKDAALPVGVAVAGAAALAASSLAATAGISIMAAAAYWAAPVVLVTVAIVTIIDGIARTAQADRWRVLCISMRDMRRSGDIPGAQLLWAKATKEISAISQTQPQPPGSQGLGQRDDSDWYDPTHPFGFPYPGFPGMPAGATAEEYKRWPHLLPTTMTNNEGRTLNPRELLQVFAQDVADARAWGLANGVPGVVPRLVRGDPSKPATNRARYDSYTYDLVTTGPRDIRSWQPLAERMAALGQLCGSLAAVLPWLPGVALTEQTIAAHATPEEKAVDAARRANTQDPARDRTLTVGTSGQVVTVPAGTPGAVSPKQAAAVTRVTGVKGPAAVALAQEEQQAVADTVAERMGNTGGGISGNANQGGGKTRAATTGTSSGGNTGTGSNTAGRDGTGGSGNTGGGGNAGRWANTTGGVN